jgi:hypothetical protein
MILYTIAQVSTLLSGQSHMDDFFLHLGQKITKFRFSYSFLFLVCNISNYEIREMRILVLKLSDKFPI